MKETPTAVNENYFEWVLLLPPQLGKTAYQTLLQYECVARAWHLDGQYGSRIHKYNFGKDENTYYVGIPIRSKQILLQAAELPENYLEKEYEESVSKRKRQNDKNMLQKMILENDTHLVYKPYIPSNRRQGPPPFDATIHPERAPTTNASTKNTNHNNALQNSSKKNKISFTYAELFTGIGGFGIALEALGGKCLFASEIEECCHRVYLDNFPQNKGVLHHDIYKVPDSAFPENLDLLVGGFPCQPFSAMGQQPGLECPKGNLFLEIVRVLNKSRPKAFLLENVPGLLQMTETYETIVKSLQDAGYYVTSEVLDARCLTATTRKRLYFVGLRKDVDNDNIQISDKSNNKPFEFPYIQDLGLRGRDVISYETSTSDAPTHVDGTEINLLRITDEQLERLDTQKFWRPAKLAWPSHTCNTIVSHYGNSMSRGHSQMVPCWSQNNPRRFSPRECARIMGFPNSYKLRTFEEQKGVRPSLPEHDTEMVPTSQNDERTNNKVDSILNVGSSPWAPMTHIKTYYRMFGNAVCPPLIAALAGAVLDRCPEIKDVDLDFDLAEWGRTIAIRLANQSTLTKCNVPYGE